MRFDLIMLYKLINGIIDIDPSSIIQIKTNNITRGHSKRLLIDKARIDLRRNLLKNRVASVWNNLDDNIVNAKTFQSSNLKLKILLINILIKYVKYISLLNCVLYCLFYSMFINYFPVHIIRHTILIMYYYYIFILRFVIVLRFKLYYLCIVYYSYYVYNS